MEEKKPKQKLIKKLKVRYRLVLMTENTFEERYSVHLTPMNLFIGISAGIVLFTLIVVSLIAFTPVREYIPGYANSKKFERLYRNQSLALDSMSNVVKDMKFKSRILKDIIDGKTPSDSSMRLMNDSAIGVIQKMIDDRLMAFDNREYFRKEMETNPTVPDNFMFIAPVKGFVTEKFSPDANHSAVDVVAKPDEAVKSTLAGTVVFSSWTPDAGHVIGIQHPNNIFSVYKHNSVLLKNAGAFVNAGDAIAIVGNSGELTTGPHLHFELWHNGSPLNPEDFMKF
ncbi:MAG: M23 family metallopeptidase [Bacteroidota bacterium]|nr:M23 family metallopeptidase [Bacteroidota bacterium]